MGEGSTWGSLISRDLHRTENEDFDTRSLDYWAYVEDIGDRKHGDLSSGGVCVDIAGTGGVCGDFEIARYWDEETGFDVEGASCEVSELVTWLTADFHVEADV